jgi:hypothetical protein
VYVTLLWIVLQPVTACIRPSSATQDSSLHKYQAKLIRKTTRQKKEALVIIFRYLHFSFHLNERKKTLTKQINY